MYLLVRPNKKISVFRVMGLKILGRVGTQIFFLKTYNFMDHEKHFAFQNAWNEFYFQKT